MNPLSFAFGAVVGLSLGLTGGGGAIFAVPLLVYGLGVPARDAVAISLAAVGATSFIGFLHRWRLGEVELRPGLLFAVAGMLGAPLGTWLSGQIPDAALLIAFAGLMLVVAVRLWRQASRTVVLPIDCPPPDAADGPTCQRDSAGALLLNSRCARLLFVVGVLTGVLSGLFGVGGGFVIVPALVLFSSMPMHRAVGTSLMVIALVSVSGVVSQFGAGRSLPIAVTLPFVAGGVGGLFAGQRIGRRLSGPVLQKVFVVAILAVAVYVIARNLSS
ncbi:MAG: sulfite exporter TauE/SafE family protein [Pirellulales bacterium]